MFRSAYYKGYPARYRELRHGDIEMLILFGFIPIVAGLSLGIACVYFSIISAIKTITVQNVIFILITAPLTFLFAYAFFAIFLGGLKQASPARVVPYFPRAIGERSFLPPKTGKNLARHCEVIDQLATEIGVFPLIHFGLNDDFRNQPITWHDPKEGLPTLDKLLLHIEDNPLALPSAAIAELADLAKILRKANEHQIAFSLVLIGTIRHSDHVEFSAKEGSFT